MAKKTLSAAEKIVAQNYLATKAAEVAAGHLTQPNLRDMLKADCGLDIEKHTVGTMWQAMAEAGMVAPWPSKPRATKGQTPTAAGPPPGWWDEVLVLLRRLAGAPVQPANRAPEPTPTLLPTPPQPPARLVAVGRLERPPFGAKFIEEQDGVTTCCVSGRVLARVKPHIEKLLTACGAATDVPIGDGWQVYLAFADHRLVGVGALVKGRDAAWLRVAAVHPDYRGIGVHKLLIERRIKHYKTYPTAHKTKLKVMCLPGQAKDNCIAAGFVWDGDEDGMEVFVYNDTTA